MTPGRGAGKIRAVFFDAGNTLIRPYPSLGYWYSRTAVRYGRKVPARQIELKFHELVRIRGGLGELGHQASFKKEKAWWRVRVRELFDPFGGIPRFEPFFEDLFDRFGRAATWRLVPGAAGTLSRLKRRGFLLGIISNWDRRLLRIADGLGLTERVETVLPSGTIGIAKPHPGIFRTALAALGVRPQEALHVGDSLEEDYYGARKAGLHALWLAPGKARVRGVPCIRSLSEIHDWLR